MQSHDMTVGSQDRPTELAYAPMSISGFGRHMGKGYGEILDSIEDLDDH